MIYSLFSQEDKLISLITVVSSLVYLWTCCDYLQMDCTYFSSMDCNFLTHLKVIFNFNFRPAIDIFLKNTKVVKF